MNNPPQLSVIIPCYRSSAPLREQVDALIRQEAGPRREILLCDNGHNAWLPAYVARLDPLPDDVSVRVIHADDHPGAAYARNRGIREARANLLAFCDDDDLVHPEWCRLAVDLLAEYPVVTGGIVVKDDRDLEPLSAEEKQALLIAETVGVPPRPAARGSMGPALMGGNFAARREVLMAVGGFDAALVRGGEDNDLAYRLNAAGVPITDCGAMSIIYARPSTLRDRMRTRSRAGRALVEAVSARNAWADTPELVSTPVRELGRAAFAAGAMAVGLKERDWAGATDRMATAWGLTRGWLAHRFFRSEIESAVGSGLDAPAS